MRSLIFRGIFCLLMYIIHFYSTVIILSVYIKVLYPFSEKLSGKKGKPNEE